MVVFALEEIELDRVGVVGLDANEVFGKAHSAGAVVVLRHRADQVV